MKLYFIGQKVVKLTKKTDLLFSAICVESRKVV